MKTRSLNQSTGFVILFTTLYIQVALELLFKFQCHLYVITVEEEQKLWDYKVFVIDELKGLQRAVFFYIGERFCIRGGEEQRSLGPSQFIRSENGCVPPIFRVKR